MCNTVFGIIQSINPKILQARQISDLISAPAKHKKQFA
jgi:hypothetical protein